MARATSDVEICNLALTEINQRLISSLDAEPEDSPQQAYCKLVYNTARRSLLESYDWSFALERAKITANKVYTTNETLLARGEPFTNDYFGWQSAFQLPADCLKVSGVYDEYWRKIVNIQSPHLAWAKQGDMIFTQQGYSSVSGNVTLPKLFLQYVKDIEDVNRFSPSFIEALALNIARKLTKQFNNSAAFSQLLDVKFDEALREAKLRDFRQTNTEGVLSYPMLAEDLWGF